MKRNCRSATIVLYAIPGPEPYAPRGSVSGKLRSGDVLTVFVHSSHRLNDYCMKWNLARLGT
jgi:hypothetical protein